MRRDPAKQMESSLTEHPALCLADKFYQLSFPSFLSAVNRVTTFAISIIIILLGLLPFCPPAFSQTEGAQTDSIYAVNLLPVADWQFVADSKAAGDEGKSVSLPFILLDGLAQQFNLSCEFSLPPDSNRIYLLRFDGINHACRITINDRFLHSHALGNAPFQLEIPGEMLRLGESNELRLNIDNYLDYKRTVPSLSGNQQPRNETGLIRTVELLSMSEVYISAIELFQEPLSRDRRRLEARVTLRNGATAVGLAPAVEYQITLEVEGRSTRLTVPLHPQSTAVSSLELTLRDVPTWSISEPRLVPVRFILHDPDGVRLDQRSFAYGFRDLEVNEGELQLNREPFELQGLVYHLDGEAGQLLTEQQLTNDVELIKNLGFNTILLQGSCAPRELLRVCDRSGLFVIDNLPVEHPTRAQLQSEPFNQAAAAYLVSLLERDCSHPSLLALNLLTGGQLGTEATETYLAQLAAVLPDRAPLTAGRFITVTHAPGPFPALLFLDGRQPMAELALQPDQVWLAGGIGLLAEADNRTGYADPFSEIHQAHALDLLLQEYAASVGYAGLLLHSFSDWHTAHPLLWGTDPRDLSLRTDGLYTIDRQEKIAARVVHSHLTSAALPPLTRGDYQATTPIWPAIIPLLLLLFLVIAMKHNNILALNLKRSLVHVEGFYLDIQARRIQQQGQGIFIALINSLMLASLLAVTFYFFRKNLLFDEILTLLMPYAGFKTLFIRLSWQPLLMALYSGLVLFLLQWITGLLLFLLGLIFGSTTTLRQILQYLFWSAAPLLFLLPVAVAAGHLLAISSGTVILLLLLAIFALWHLVRLYRISHFAYPAHHGKVIAVLLVLLVLLLAGFFFYYETGLAFTDRLRYLLGVY